MAAVQPRSAVIIKPEDAAAAQELGVSLLEGLLLAASERPALPIRAHSDRLSSGARGLSLTALRAIRTFFGRHGGLSKLMDKVCKEEGFDASVCKLTASTGLSLAESMVHAAAQAGADVTRLVGDATSFFSYSWTGTKLEDMLASIERKVEALEMADGTPRYVWVDMFAASQNLLAGSFLPLAQAERDSLKASDPAGYAARKEATDTIFDDAISAVGTSGPREIFLYLSPLTGEWLAPLHQFLLPGRGEPPANWLRKGPGAITRAWCW